MKKVILALTIATLTLTSCGSGEPVEAPKADSVVVAEPTVDTTLVKPVETSTVVVKDTVKAK